MAQVVSETNAGRMVSASFDVALCDFVLALGALALGRLSQEFSSK